MAESVNVISTLHTRFNTQHLKPRLAYTSVLNKAVHGSAEPRPEPVLDKRFRFLCWGEFIVPVLSQESTKPVQMSSSFNFLSKI